MGKTIHPPPQMIDRWHQGADVVYAVRYARKEGLCKRLLFSAFYRILRSVSSVSIPKDAGNFGIVDRCVIEQLRRLPECDRYFPGLRSWVGFKQSEIPVERWPGMMERRAFIFGPCILGEDGSVWFFARTPACLLLAGGSLGIGFRRLHLFRTVPQVVHRTSYSRMDLDHQRFRFLWSHQCLRHRHLGRVRGSNL